MTSGMGLLLGLRCEISKKGNGTWRKKMRYDLNETIFLLPMASLNEPMLQNPRS